MSAWREQSATQRVRDRERFLLLLATMFVGVNALALSVLRNLSPDPLGLAALWMLCAWGGHALLARFVPLRDPFLFALVMFLCGWGLLLIERLAPFFAARQAIWLLLSTCTLLLVAGTPYALRWLRRYRYVWLVVGLSLLVGTILLGRNPSGVAGAPELWLGVGDVFFQPSEALKVILVAFLASYLAEQYPALHALGAVSGRQLWLAPRILGPILLMWSLCVVILIWQRDLGTAALFFVVFLLLLYVATGQPLILLSGGLLLAGAAAVAYRLFAVVRLRFDIWLDPWAEADGRAYQIVQSLMAFAHGGVFGQGIGQGSPTYIPVVHTDFVFAALAEEWGLLGVLVLLAVLGVMVLRGLRVALLQGERAFYVLLAVGLTALIGVQSLLIMGGVLKLLPLTGVTLPFVSYGGSSLLMSCVIAGVLIRLSGEGSDALHA